jgi:hypothetical protein
MRHEARKGSGYGQLVLIVIIIPQKYPLTSLQMVFSSKIFHKMGILFQNSAGFGIIPQKNQSKPGFPIRFKEAVPKTEVLEQPHGTIQCLSRG